MPKRFKTKIAHKAGSSIEVLGLQINLTPEHGAEGLAICHFSVPDDRDDVFARLVEIPEGFEYLGEDQDEDDTSEPIESESGNFVLENSAGQKVDLYQLDRAALVAIGGDIGLTFPGRLGIAKVREQIIAAVNKD